MRHNSPLVTILPAVPAGISEIRSRAPRKNRRLFVLWVISALGGALIFGFVWPVR